jgi:hypothetical protein
MTDNHKMTLTAWAYKQIRRGRSASGYWLEIGKAGAGEDGETKVYLDRTPLGGWTGAVRLRPAGAGPPKLPAPKPQRPDQQADEEETEE